ncbi:hypothetical protein EYF80_016545 [Liparis tanakae]|uniref:Uncharacterized protein n=1 Tax=Liparis tanakae TaxID=230148 RepID=A0A4Z2I7B4_9TELE|nr:hypothetical protein EYF80_016545 [Liparis tanakae]
MTQNFYSRLSDPRTITISHPSRGNASLSGPQAVSRDIIIRHCMDVHCHCSSIDTLEAVSPRLPFSSLSGQCELQLTRVHRSSVGTITVLFQSIWNGKHVNAIVGGAAADDRSADVLQGEGLCAVDGVGQQGLEEHAGVGILVVFQQARHRGSVEHTRVVHVKAKIVVPLFDACVQRAAVAAETNGEEVVLLSRVAQEEGAFGLPLQQGLGLVAVHHPPVTRQVGDLQQVWNQTVNVIDLSVDAVAVVRCGVLGWSK